MDEAPARVRVWPWWLRVLHWGLAVTVIASFLTHEGGGVWHERWGYAALAFSASRVVMGWRGPRGCGAHTRLAGWLRSPADTWRYAVAHLRGHAPRYVGHNPLGGWMMALLLADTLACGLTGWLYTTDRFWGAAWLEELHGALGEAFVPLVVLHVAGALWASRAQRENLVAAMVHGHKRPPAPGDVA